MRALAVSLVLSLVACKASVEAPPDEPLYRGGSRLKARVLETPGGGRAFLAFYDTELGFECLPAQATDGVVRCLPTLRRNDTGSAFADSTCTKPAASRSCIEDSYFTVGECESRVYRYGAKTAKTFANLGGSCQVSPSNTELFTVEPVVLATLVSFTAYNEEAGGVRVTRFESSDGAILISDTRIASSGAHCYVSSRLGGLWMPPPYACVPFFAWNVETGYFEDAACSKPAAYFIEQCNHELPTAALNPYSADRCTGATPEWWAIDAVLDRGYAQGSTCAEFSAGGHRYARVGSRIELTTFPALQRDDAGDGPFRGVRYRAGGRLVAQEIGNLFDDYGECNLVRAKDGSLHCVPSTTIGRYSTPTFSDPACTKRVYWTPESYCGDPIELAFSVVSTDSCSLGMTGTVHRLGAPHTGDVYERTRTDPPTCALRAASPGVWLTEGEEVPVEAFDEVRVSDL